MTAVGSPSVEGRATALRSAWRQDRVHGRLMSPDAGASGCTGSVTTGGDDLAFSPAVELARRYRDGSLHPLEVLEACLARISLLQEHYRPFCFLYPDEARLAARS